MERWLRRIGIALAGVAGLIGIAALAIYLRSEAILTRSYPLPEETVPIPQDPAALAEGARLATVYGCMDGCHGRQGEGVLFFDEPVIARLVAPSLHGAARRYSDAQLVTIIRHGLRPDGRSVFIMPSQTFTFMTDADVGRIVAYLRSLPPLDGPGPQVTLGPLGRIGLVTGKFETAAQLLAQRVDVPPARSERAEHGRYLARTICAECHGRSLAGDSNPEFTAPDLRIVAAYSAEQFRHLMRTGEPIGERTLRIMRVRAQRNLSHLTDEEIAALYEYLRGLAVG